MMITKVKICGITNYEDGAAAMDLDLDGRDEVMIRHQGQMVTLVPAAKENE